MGTACVVYEAKQFANTALLDASLRQQYHVQQGREEETKEEDEKRAMSAFGAAAPVLGLLACGTCGICCTALFSLGWSIYGWVTYFSNPGSESDPADGPANQAEQCQKGRQFFLYFALVGLIILCAQQMCQPKNP